MSSEVVYLVEALLNEIRDIRSELQEINEKLDQILDSQREQKEK